MGRTVIIGDGPAGLSAALLLAKNGHETLIYGRDDTLLHHAHLHNYLGVLDTDGSAFQATARDQVEAVGARHYQDYFRSVSRHLERGAPFGVQAITIHDRHFERARRAVDFIQRHIFPGSCIPSVEALTRAATRASDMRLVEMEDFGGHYARTLRIWRDALRARWNEARALGFDDDFVRLFDFYFAYCEGGFLERAISDVHLLLAGPGFRK